MLQSESQLVLDFSSGLQVIETLIINHLAKRLQIKEIAINTSPLLSQSIVCQFDKNNASHISVKKLLELFIQRWMKEIQYFEEIARLKDQIIEEFNKLCPGGSDEKLFESVCNYRQKVVDLLFVKTRIENKQNASTFCKGLMNGFENEMLDRFDYYAHDLLWTSYPTPIPERMIELVKNIFKKLTVKSLNEDNLAEASMQITSFIEDHFKKLQICIKPKESGILSLVKGAFDKFSKKSKKEILCEKLKNKINEIHDQRKICFLLIEKSNEFDSLIKNERMNIGCIIVKMAAKDFVKITIPFFYEVLMLSSLDKEFDFDLIAKKLPKGLKRLYIVLSQSFDKSLIDPEEIIEIIQNDRINTNKLSIKLYGDSAAYKKLVSCIIQATKLPFYLSVCNLLYQFFKKIMNFSNRNFSLFDHKHYEYFPNIKNSSFINSLDLNYRLNIQINRVFLQHLIQAIEAISSNNKEIILDLREHQLSYEDTQILMNFQKSNPNYYLLYNPKLKLNFNNSKNINQIDHLKAGLDTLQKDAELRLDLTASEFKKECENNLLKLMKILSIHVLLVVYLKFNLQNCGTSSNRTGRECLREIVGIVGKMKYIYTLNINLAENKIGIEEAKEIANALEELTNIKNLDLNLENNNIQKEGTTQIAQSLTNLNQISSLKLNFNNNDIGKEGANAIAQSLQHLSSISDLTLELKFNDIQLEGATEIANSLQRLTQLFMLQLGLVSTGIGKNGVIQIVTALQALQRLSNLNLDLQNTDMKDIGAFELGNALKNFKNLNFIELNLNENKIGDNGAITIAHSLKKLEKTTKIVLSLKENNSITGTGKSEVEALKNYFSEPDIKI